MSANTKPRKAPGFPASLQTARSGTQAAPPGAGLLRPQRPVHEAALDAQRHTVPAGLGLDSAAVRMRMVERLRAQGVAGDEVLAAMLKVPRHAFVDAALATQAYEDTSLPIGLGQTISKPSVVARMIQLLTEAAPFRQRGHLGRVLEIGTGCGYQAAVLSLLASRVVSVERVRALHDKAQEYLACWREGGELQLRFGDGTAANIAQGPFDAIISAAGGEALPPSWLAMLAEGGRLVAPVAGSNPLVQTLCIVDKSNGELHRQQREAVHFVPLKSGTQ